MNTLKGPKDMDFLIRKDDPCAAGIFDLGISS